MSSVTIRDQVIREAWVPCDLRTPPTDPRGPHYPVTVMGIVDDERFKLPDGNKRFVDVVTYWPALHIWTATFMLRADQGASDYRVNVTFWQPLLPMPW